MVKGIEKGEQESIDGKEGKKKYCVLSLICRNIAYVWKLEPLAWEKGASRMGRVIDVHMNVEWDICGEIT